MPQHFTDPRTPIGGTSRTVGDFWKWGFSDIVANDTRGAFAEFLVGVALDCIDFPRVSWDAVDLRYRGTGIEVKSTARWQSWPQKQPSRPEFGIAPRRGWDAATGESTLEASRSADIWVFAYVDAFPITTHQLADPSFWEFYVVPVGVLDQSHRSQKRIALSQVRRLAKPTAFGSLKASIDAHLNRSG